MCIVGVLVASCECVVEGAEAHAVAQLEIQTCLMSTYLPHPHCPLPSADVYLVLHALLHLALFCSHMYCI